MQQFSDILGPPRDGYEYGAHWLKEDMRAGRGNEKAWTVGEERTSPLKKLVICEKGYHASPSLWDALKYAPGPMACLVEVSTPVARQSDKSVSKSRKLLAVVDVSNELRQFAIDCAVRALERERALGREPDERSWAAVRAAQAFLRGEITPEQYAAAYAAASAAYAAAYAAAAYSAAYCAIAAAYSAAYSAAAAAAAYAYAAEREWQKERFSALVMSRLEDAARFSEVPHA